MNISSDMWRVHAQHETFFWAYRWLAWVIAGLALTLPAEPLLRLPRDAGLWGLLGVLTIGATAFAQLYVRLIQERPITLLLDGLLGFCFVWLSEGNILPFLPYTLGVLILPALLWGWRGAFGMVAGFVAIDLLGMQFLGLLGSYGWFELALRASIPLAFALIWLMVGQRRNAHDDPAQQSDWDSSLYPTPAFLSFQMNQIPPLTPLVAPSNDPTLSPNHPPRPTSLQAPPEPMKHAGIFSTAVGEQITFPTAIEQLVLGTNRQSSFDLQLNTVGHVRPLSNAQQSVMLRVAQEAVLNVQHHAHAQHAILTLDYAPQSFTLMVQDDGVGLLDGTHERPGMHALRALRYRLAEMDGELLVAEQPSGGVVLEARIPLE
ncbi:putative signal transduction histidine kinase [Oscillochloris trichoides DG-6]|uniref:Signal transduction histidine kinase n=1 Tax=Oscillochloris trichoides DG-6 TaxID=765420 RepID=E1IIA1_9CHLR|nr:ATP-binding protein [Oscillochloris trichoides]EFO79087.1 putative signal transduction histidine kinase [Oscillochloris trichoides DG-6]